MKKVMLACLVGLFLVMSINMVRAQENKICAIYFTGVGCPHCARTDPIVLKELPVENKNFVVIEYEIYQTQGNGPVLLKYSSKYRVGEGIPLIIFSNSSYIIGDNPILNNIKNKLEELSYGNKCLLLNSSIDFDNLNFNDLPGHPKIWTNGRVLIRVTDGKTSSSSMRLMKELLFTNKLNELISDNGLKEVEPFPVHLSGRDVYFEGATEIDNWVLEYGMKNGSESNTKGNNYVVPAIVVSLAAIILVTLFVVVMKK
ncbi:MAG: hypothetical protein J7K87_03555 [Candidatus Aenigmarchaeota archaeon]|nr:hypothetical protein [Candidatus Aenigmarchaeota archaeon]